MELDRPDAPTTDAGSTTHTSVLVPTAAVLLAAGVASFVLGLIVSGVIAVLMLLFGVATVGWISPIMAHVGARRSGDDAGGVVALVAAATVICAVPMWMVVAAWSFVALFFGGEGNTLD